MFKIIQRVVRSLIIVITTFCVIGFGLISWFFYGFHTASIQADPRIALWIGHSFSTEGANFATLSEDIGNLNVTDLYFHVGPLTEKGTLASNLLIDKAALEKLFADGVTNFAWIGAVRSQLDLSNPAVRTQIISSAKWTLSQGFNGIHLDIEPIHADDNDFFTLLTELNAALATDFPSAKISLATDEWQPHYLTQKIAKISNTSMKSYWTTDQIRRAAALADQIVVMTYDTGFHDPALYSWWVEQQSIALSNIVPENVELFIGLPVYEEGESFDPATENLLTGLQGFTRAAQNIRSNGDRITGIAIYPYWEMTGEDFKTLSTL